MALVKNPDVLGEFEKLYYILDPVPIDLSTAADMPDGTEDSTVLALDWNELCVSTVSPSSNINNYQIQDRCTGSIIGNTPGREGFTLDVTMNQFRLDDPFDVYSWHTAMETRAIIALLCLTADITEPGAWGFVGNFVRIDESEDQPEAGVATITYSFGPAARAPAPLKRRIYGSGVDRTGGGALLTASKNKAADKSKA